MSTLEDVRTLRECALLARCRDRRLTYQVTDRFLFSF